MGAASSAGRRCSRCVTIHFRQRALGDAASGRTAEELLRRLVRAVLEHQGGSGLRDDATLLLVQWTGT
jgi:hypothetical protein